MALPKNFIQNWRLNKTNLMRDITKIFGDSELLWHIILFQLVQEDAVMVILSPISLEGFIWWCHMYNFLETYAQIEPSDWTSPLIGRQDMCLSQTHKVI